MITKRKYFFTIFYILSINLYSQEFDPSIISELSPEQIEKAKSAISSNNIDLEPDILATDTDETLVDQENDVLDSTEEGIKKFGYNFFSKMPTSISAIGDLPLPNDYKVSLKDQFTIILTGSKNIKYNLAVKLDGSILFPELGSIYVAGLSLKEVKNKLSDMIDKSYIGVNIDVSLSNLSAKKITIVGAVETPGTYIINPFSTITSALAYSGGILEIGSLRNIKLIRNDGEVYIFDLYELLIRGNRSKDISVEAGDTILIEPATKFIDITGSVNRPGTYELKNNETLEDLVDYALGFTNTANKNNISVSLLDLEAGAITKKTVNHLTQNLDNVLFVEVFEYLNKENSNVAVYGAVKESGYYDLNKYKYLGDLIKDLRFVDVYPWLAVLEQYDSNNLTTISKLFSLNDPATYESVKLLPNSKVYFTDIKSRSFDVSEISASKIKDYQLIINHKSGVYEMPIYGKYSVTSLIDFLGLDMSDIDSQATYLSPLDDLSISSKYSEMEFTAKKYNIISFRSYANDTINVTVEGAVEFPGSYSLSSNTSLEELYEIVGKFKQEAFRDGIIFSRESIKARQVESIETSKKEFNDAIALSSKEGTNIADVTKIMEEVYKNIDINNLGRISGDFSPGSTSSKNTILLDGDKIIVPKNSFIVNVLGEVLNPTAFEYSKKLNIQSVIEKAGGYRELADKKRVYVIKANGLIRTKTRNIFTGNVNIEPGDTIVVPRKIIVQNPITEALLPVTQILSDLAFSAAAIESLSNSN